MNQIETEGQLIKTALGDNWNHLSPKVQKRFEYEPQPDKPKEYVGEMSEISCSMMGVLFAYFGRLFKAPLIPYSGNSVPIEVKVYKKANRPEIYKTRTYYFKGKKPITVQSAMSLSENNVFTEMVNSWLGMTMQVLTKDGNLYFEGKKYFVKIGSKLIAIPTVLSPGIAYVEHQDYEDESFRVKIEMIHPWFGRMFLQDGVFKEKE